MEKTEAEAIGWMTNIVGCERERRFIGRTTLKWWPRVVNVRSRTVDDCQRSLRPDVKGLKLKLLAWGREVSSDWSYYQMIYVQKPIIIYFQAKTMSHLVQSLLQQQHWCVLRFLTNSLLWLRFAVFR